ncbi:MAG: DMT family transporter [Rickettsiales bacterium]|nr:DMT family transporter [Rickettsiales bacterium]
MKGILWMILHCFLISIVVALAKLLGQRGFGVMQIVFFHSFVAFLLLVPMGIMREGSSLIKTKHFTLHLFRSILGVMSLFLYFFALKFIPLTDARAVALFGPVITFIFAVLFLKERLDLKELLALALSLIGGYIILNPGTISFHFMSVLILLAMIMWSMIDLIIKKLSKTESGLKQLFFLNGFMSLFSIIFIGEDWKMPENILDILLLLLVGVIFFFNSLAIFCAIKNGDLTTIMPFDFSGMIFTAILSYFIFDEIITDTTLIGSVIVFVSSLYLIYHAGKPVTELTTIAESNRQKK